MHMNLVCILNFMSNKTSTAFSDTSVNFQECVFSVTSNFNFWFTLNVIYLFVILLAAFFMIYSNRNIFHVLKFSHAPHTESICRYSRSYWKFRVNREWEGTWQYTQEFMSDVEDVLFFEVLCLLPHLLHQQPKICNWQHFSMGSTGGKWIFMSKVFYEIK